MISKPKRTNNSGFNLTEMLVYMAVALILINLVATVMVQCSRLSAVNSLAFARLNGARDIQQTFTESVRRADRIETRIGDHTTGENKLVLRTTASNGGARYIVMGRFGGDRFRLLEIRETKNGFEAEKYITLPCRLDQLSFNIRNNAARPLISLDATLAREYGERNTPRRSIRCVAAPRGTLVAGMKDRSP